MAVGRPPGETGPRASSRGDCAGQPRTWSLAVVAVLLVAVLQARARSASMECRVRPCPQPCKIVWERDTPCDTKKMQSSEVVPECSARVVSSVLLLVEAGGGVVGSPYTRAVAGSNPVLAGSRRDVSPHSRRAPSGLGGRTNAPTRSSARRRMRSTSRCCCCCGPSGAPRWPPGPSQRPWPTSAGRSAGAASPQTPMSSDRSRSSWLDPCHERESAFAKPVVRSRRERLPELGRVRSISPVQGPAGNEAVGRGER